MTSNTPIFEDYLPNTLSESSLNSEDVKYVDDLIGDYLLWRGFIQTKKRFAREIEDDKNKGFHVCSCCYAVNASRNSYAQWKASKIVEQLFLFIRQLDIEGLIGLWGHLNETFFSHLDEDLSWTVSKLELSLKRYYLVSAMQMSRPEKVVQFFETYGAELASTKHWRAWFGT